MPIRFTTAGESHGRGLVGVLEGIPAGLPLSAEAVNAELQRRMGGYGRGARMKIESDQIEWLAGVRARETAARVACGAVSKVLLAHFGIEIGSHVVELGGVVATTRPPLPTPLNEAADASPVRCLDPAAEREMIARIDAAKAAGDTLGGVVEVVASGVPVGLGSHVSWDRKLDGRLAQ